MSKDKFQNHYRVASARATWFRYDGGTYYITICTKNREYYFGTINDIIMHLSEIGQFVQENIQGIESHYPYAGMPLFVVMPNHIHAIIFIDRDKTPEPRRQIMPINDDFENVTCGRDAARHVSTSGHVSTTGGMPDINNKMRKIANQQGWLSVVMGGLKSAVTRYANQNKIEFAWQARFHDRIIRDLVELNNISDYIENNVSRWKSDRFFEGKKGITDDI